MLKWTVFLETLLVCNAFGLEPKTIEVQTRATPYFDVSVAIDGEKQSFTEPVNKKFFTKINDQSNGINKLSICFSLKKQAPKVPSNARNLGLVVVKSIEKSRSLVEIVRVVSPVSTEMKVGEPFCSNYLYQVSDDGVADIYEEEINPVKLAAAVKPSVELKLAEAMKPKEPVKLAEAPPPQIAKTANVPQPVKQVHPAPPAVHIKVEKSKTVQPTPSPLMQWVAKFAVLLSIFLLVALFLTGYAVWKIYSDAGEPGWYSIVPVLNIYTWWKISGAPNVTLYLIFGPGLANLFLSDNLPGIINALLGLVSAVGALMINLGMAKRYHRSTGFAIGLWLMPYIFYPILAFIGEGSIHHEPPSRSTNADVTTKVKSDDFTFDQAA